MDEREKKFPLLPPTECVTFCLSSHESADDGGRKHIWKREFKSPWRSIH